MSYNNGIDNPAQYFNTILYTGNSSTQSITGLGHSPNFVWIKDRIGATSVYSHHLFDSVRGATKYVLADATDAEATVATTLTSFDSDGFSLGSDASTNASGDATVAWCWKESATSGMDIVSFEGTGSAHMVSHSLSAKPKLVIAKNRERVSDWLVYHAGMDATGDYALFLHSNSAKDNSQNYWGDTEATTSAFSVGTRQENNQSGEDIIAYCFADVQGFSKVSGKYTGNGSSDGVYLHLGFFPSFLMVKRIDSHNQWIMMDTKRTPANTGTVPELFADLSAAENSATDGRFDFLANGVKARGTNAAVNASGATYIYMAWADTPFVNSKGVPANAR